MPRKKLGESQTCQYSRVFNPEILDLFSSEADRRENRNGISRTVDERTGTETGTRNPGDIREERNRGRLRTSGPNVRRQRQETLPTKGYAGTDSRWRGRTYRQTTRSGLRLHCRVARSGCSEKVRNRRVGSGFYRKYRLETTVEDGRLILGQLWVR